MTTSCVHCSGPVDTATSYRRVVGWERRASFSASRKGGSDIVLREPLDEWACATCVRRLRDGISPAQGTLA